MCWICDRLLHSSANLRLEYMILRMIVHKINTVITNPNKGIAELHFNTKSNGNRKHTTSFRMIASFSYQQNDIDKQKMNPYKLLFNLCKIIKVKKMETDMMNEKSDFEDILTTL